MRYLPKSPADREEMLAEIGVASIDDLFASIPAEYQLKRDLAVPRQHGESEILDRFRAFAENNASGYASFLGAGVYRHYRPVVIDALVQRGIDSNPVVFETKANRMVNGLTPNFHGRSLGWLHEFDRVGQDV